MNQGRNVVLTGRASFQTTHSASAHHCLPCHRNIQQFAWVPPADWKCTNISAIFKGGDSHLPANYHSVSLTIELTRVLERLAKKGHLIHHRPARWVLRPTIWFSATSIMSVEHDDCSRGMGSSGSFPYTHTHGIRRLLQSFRLREPSLIPRAA